jgi:NitT/TauT family transport system ATP-binding protein
LTVEPPLVSLVNIGKSFHSPGAERRVLDGLTMTIASGEAIAIMGANGVGKSTLAGILAGIDSDFDGTMQMPPGAPRQSPMIFQDFRASLLPWLSIEANIGFPLMLQGMARADRRRKVQAIIDRAPVRLSMATPVSRLSGGQAQLVCVLRGLVVSPRMLVCDEPFSAIDAPARLMLRKLIREVCRAERIALVFVSHSIEDSLFMADRILILSGSPAKISQEVAVASPEARDDEWLEGPYAGGQRRILRNTFSSWA